jgi:hypothetical protein
MIMSEQPERKRTLREIELEVEAEGREWMRQRLEEKLQKEADRDGAIFPPQPKQGPASAPKGAALKDRRRPG